MPSLAYPLLRLLAHLLLPRFNAQLQLLLIQIRMLRGRLDCDRIVPTPEERAELLHWGEALDHRVDGVLRVVRPATYRKWLRQRRTGKPARRAGRPPLYHQLRALICRLARENLHWGHRRIVGELRKLGITPAPSTVWRILKAAGIPALPEKGGKNPIIPWTAFVRANLDSLVACDFFVKPVWTLRGRFYAYVFVFLHLGSRKAWCSRATFAPDGDWIVQQSRNAAIWLEEIGAEPKFLIRDNDGKYPNRLDDFWHAQGVRCLRIPAGAPQANAFAESLIGTIKRECLNFFVCFSLGQIDCIVRTWGRHYNTERPHRGIGMENNVLHEHFVPSRDGPVRCKQELGGIIKSYYREAA